MPPYRQARLLPASWTDLAFLVQVAISIHTVDDLSTVGHLGVILPCQRRRPLALIEVGMWMGRHLVAVLTADGSAARAVQVHHDDSDSRDATRATYPDSDRAPPPAQRLKPSPSGSIRAIGRDENPLEHETLVRASLTSIHSQRRSRMEWTAL